MSEISLGDARFHYELEGDASAPAVLLSNSLGTDLHMWDSQMPALLKKFRVLRYDTRGHGGSTATPGPYTLAQLGQDALRLLDALKLNRVSMAGVSLGGMTTLWLAANHPDRISRIVPSFTSAYMGGTDLWNQRIATVQRDGLAAIADAVIPRWFSPAFMAEAPEQVRRFRAMLDAMPPQGYAATCAAVRDMDLRPDLGRIKAPTLVVIGSLDLAATPDQGRGIVAGIPGAQVLELPCAHIGNVEAAAAYTEALLAFLTAR